jgi:hypothetical protein
MRGRPENTKAAGARESGRCQAIDGKTLKTHFGDELERLREKGHERTVVSTTQVEWSECREGGESS